MTEIFRDIKRTDPQYWIKSAKDWAKNLAYWAEREQEAADTSDRALYLLAVQQQNYALRRIEANIKAARESNVIQYKCVMMPDLMSPAYQGVLL